MGLSKQYYDLAIKLKREKKIDLAKEALSKAILLTAKPYYYYELALLFKQQGQWWQSIENFERAFELESSPKLSWRLNYIESLEKMNRFSKIIELFKGFEEHEFDAYAYVRYGYVLEQENQTLEAKEIFDRAIELDDKNNSKTLGIGIFYEKKGRWIEALNYYLNRAKDEPLNFLLHYKTGLSYDRNYDWYKAEQEIGHAIALESNRAYFFARLAFNYERQKKYKEASQAYQLAIIKEKNPTTEQYYRLGYTLFHAQEYKESCELFLKQEESILDKKESLELLEDEVIKEGHKKLVDLLEPLIDDINTLITGDKIEELIKLTTKIRAWGLLEKIYQFILDHDNSCSPKSYINLAYAQYKQKKYKEASENCIEQKIIQKVHSVSEKKFETDRGFREVATYAEYIKRESLQTNCIVYESRGEFIDSKPYELFLALLEDERFKAYRHILIIDNLDLLNDEIKGLKNVLCVIKGSNLYLKYLSSSQYLINDASFPSYFIRQDGQKYLNLEQIFNENSSAFGSKEYLIKKSKISQDFLQSTHIVNSNQSVIEEYSLRGIYQGKIVLSGHSIEDAIEVFFFDDESKYNVLRDDDIKQSLLIYASFEPNGITSSLNNLLNNIDKNQYNITLIIDNNTIEGYEKRIVELSKELNILIRTGRMVLTVEEQWIRDKFNAYSRLKNSEMKAILKETFNREFRRMFGNFKFDNIIDFNGYRAFWSTLFAFGDTYHKSIYLHNDMEKEYRIRYPSLGKAFFLYQYFDNLISVSETVHQSNVERLTKRYNLKEEQFIFANNVIDFKRYQQLSKDPIDSLSYKYFLEDKRIKFINVARLSPEKGQERLIMAFIKVFKTNKNIALYIMGEGFLEQKLQLLIDKFHMGHNIILLGQQKNPYPFIKNATCMILPSFHEGQALVLLEALSLNIPCISTNIAGPRSVLKDGEGVLCDDTTEAIELSLKEFVNCELKFKSFSPVFYNEVALKMFNKNMRTKN